MITIKDLTFRYKQSTRNAFEHISLQLRDGQALGVIGPSQAGKTTFGYALAGLLQKHFHGGILTGALVCGAQDELPGTSEIGFVFQDASLQLSGVTETVEEEIAFSLEQFGVSRDIMRERIEEQLSTFHLHELRHRHPKTLSGGETQMLAIASEAAKHPQMFILDEPTQPLDADHIRHLIDFLSVAKRSSTIVFIDQNLNATFELCDRILFLENGRQQFLGTPHDLLNSNTDISSLTLPELVDVQRSLGRNHISLLFKETIEWMKKFRTSA
jgi:energy-coupling factor transport system ATP-binding protein